MPRLEPEERLLLVILGSEPDHGKSLIEWIEKRIRDAESAQLDRDIKAACEHCRRGYTIFSVNGKQHVFEAYAKPCHAAAIRQG